MSSRISRSPHGSARILLALYAALALFPFAWAAITWDDFWRSVAPFSTLLVLIVLVALWRGHWWSWLVLLSLDGLVLVSFIWDPADVLAFIFALLRLLLLVAPPVRVYATGPRAAGSSTRWWPLGP